MFVKTKLYQKRRRQGWYIRILVSDRAIGQRPKTFFRGALRITLSRAYALDCRMANRGKFARYGGGAEFLSDVMATR